jgi:hypothetical protein
MNNPTKFGDNEIIRLHYLYVRPQLETSRWQKQVRTSTQTRGYYSHSGHRQTVRTDRFLLLFST